MIFGARFQLWLKRQRTDDKAKAEFEERRKALLELPQENILYFLQKTAPRLQPWQREVLRIVRKIAQYFYPQSQTKVMNEGCATYTHYTIMNRLHEKGLLTDGNMVEFLAATRTSSSSRTSTTRATRVSTRMRWASP
jgi:stage V sporulation protein R